jgi:hypothetical protein
MTKNWKNFTGGKNIIFFDKKIAIYLSLASIKDAQATGEVFIPQKKTTSNTKLEIS